MKTRKHSNDRARQVCHELWESEIAALLWVPDSGWPGFVNIQKNCKAGVKRQQSKLADWQIAQKQDCDTVAIRELFIQNIKILWQYTNIMKVDM